jgi:hypothetical protein
MQSPRYIVPELNPFESCYETMFARWNTHICSQAKVIAATIQAGSFKRREDQRPALYPLLNLLT